jgi:hypothetical protein
LEEHVSSIIKLPSGAEIEIRGLKGKEGKILSDKAAIKNGTFLDKILSACTIRVTNPGPYTPVTAPALEKGGISRDVFNWDSVLMGDRFLTLLHIRSLTLGDMFCFKIQCSAEGCRERFEHEISLLKDLQVTVLSAEDAAMVASGEPFSTRDPSGKLIRFKAPTGRDELQAARSGVGIDGVFMTALLRRIVDIEGEDIPRRYLEEQGFGELLQLLEEFDKHNCGVQTAIEIECPHCGNLEDVQIPFDRGFFAPTKLPKTS